MDKEVRSAEKMSKVQVDSDEVKMDDGFIKVSDIVDKNQMMMDNESMRCK